MGLVRKLFSKATDAVYLKVVLGVQLGALTFSSALFIWHLVVDFQGGVLLFLLADLAFLLAAVFLTVRFFQTKEIRNYENFSFATCQAYWCFFQLFLVAILAVFTGFRAFGANSSSKYAPLFAFYLIDLLVLGVASAGLWELREVTVGQWSSFRGDNYLEDFDPTTRMAVGARTASFREQETVVRGQTRGNYSFSTHVLNLGPGSPNDQPKIRLSKEKKVVSHDQLKASDTDFNSRSKQEIERSISFHSDPELNGSISGRSR